MSLVASSSPPFSPPPPCGDEKEEDSAEEEEADGGGEAPRDLGWAAAGRGGPGTAPLEPRVLGNSPQRTRSADLFLCPPPGLAEARPLALAPTFPIESASLSSHRDPANRKRNFPTPFGCRRSPQAHPWERGGDPRPKKRFPEDSRFPLLYLRKN